MKERKTEITIETYEVLVVSRQHRLSQNWCARCGMRVLAVSLHDVQASGLSPDAAQDLVGAGRLHLIEAVGCLPSVCLKSILQI